MTTTSLTLAALSLLAGDFELPSIDGTGVVSLAEHRGKRVLLIEFASW